VEGDPSADRESDELTDGAAAAGTASIGLSTGLDPVKGLVEPAAGKVGFRLPKKVFEPSGRGTLSSAVSFLSASPPTKGRRKRLTSHTSRILSTLALHRNVGCTR